MRKLTVKNFSVIKEAELEFGKITVLIGPQSTGKSLLCKLAYFLGREVLDIAVARVVNRFDFAVFELAVREEFARWFPSGGWGNGDWRIEFQSSDYRVVVKMPSHVDSHSEPTIEFAEAFRNLYSRYLQNTAGELARGFTSPVEVLRSLAGAELAALSGRGIWDRSIYIPVERSYFVDITKGYKALASESDPIAAQFAEVFANSLSATKIRSRVSKYLGADLISWPGGWMLTFHDGRSLPLHQASSGGKELLPILSLLDFYEQQRRQSGRLVSAELYGKISYVFDDFTIEEPESSVFPQTQYELVRELASLANEIDFQPSFIVTTHSPYLLSAFNDLVKCGYIAALKPDKHAEIEKVIPRQYWIDPKDFAAYAFNGKDGILRNIFNQDGENLIDGDILDNVSGDISEAFGRLLEIQYGDEMHGVGDEVH